MTDIAAFQAHTVRRTARLVEYRATPTANERISVRSASRSWMMLACISAALAAVSYLVGTVFDITGPRFVAGMALLVVFVVWLRVYKFSDASPRFRKG